MSSQVATEDRLLALGFVSQLEKLHKSFPGARVIISATATQIMITLTDSGCVHRAVGRGDTYQEAFNRAVTGPEWIKFVAASVKAEQEDYVPKMTQAELNDFPKLVGD